MSATVIVDAGAEELIHMLGRRGQHAARRALLHALRPEAGNS
jgi:hypothetical protein